MLKSELKGREVKKNEEKGEEKQIKNNGKGVGKWRWVERS